MNDIFRLIVIHFQNAADFSVDDFVRYSATHALMETIIFIFAYYFIFIYPPMRFVYGIFFGTWYKKYADQGKYVYTWRGGYPTYIGGLRLMKFFRFGEKVYSQLKPMPLWMDIIAFQVILSELGFVIFGSINYFMYY